MGCALSINKVSNEVLKDDANHTRDKIKQRRSTQHITSNVVHEEYDRDIHQYYRIDRTTILGTGVTGTVRICVHLKTGAQFALKTLYKNRIKKKSALERLRKECRIMASLDHPNILRLCEFFECPDKIYLVLELCKGGELIDRLHNQVGQRYGEFTTCSYVRTMLSAVMYCHSHGIVHRDLKLENFLFETADPKSDLKLIDFGFSQYYGTPGTDTDSGISTDSNIKDSAKHKDRNLVTETIMEVDEEDHSETNAESVVVPETMTQTHAETEVVVPETMTQTHAETEVVVTTSSAHNRIKICGPIVGTPYYIAPEVLRGEFDAKCDVWSIGVITYMLLSGVPPFDGMDDQETYNDILHGRWEFDELHFRSVSDSAKDFITKCLIQNPDERPSAADLMAHRWFDLLMSTSSSGADTATAVEGGDGEDQYNPDGLARTPLPRRPILQRRLSAVPGEIVDRIRNFEKRTMLTKVCMEVIAHSLSSDQISQLKHEFSKFDPLGTGEISHADLHDILRASKFTENISEVDLDHIIDGIDLEHSGKIRYHEFIAATLSENMITDNNLLLAFEKLSNHNSHITKADFLDLVGADSSVEEIDEMFRENNMSPDNARINFKQFKDLMRQGSPKKRSKSMDRNQSNSNTTSTVTTDTTTNTNENNLMPAPPSEQKSVLDSFYRRHKQRLLFLSEPDAPTASGGEVEKDTASRPAESL